MKFTKKIVLLLVVLALALSVAFGMVACKETPAANTDAPQEETTVESGDAVVVGYTASGTFVFTYDKAVIADVSGKHVVDYLDALVAKGLMTYGAPGGMVTTINGKEADYAARSEFWAFYTTDTENSSDMYGDPIVIDGVTYHFASYGIGDMPLKAGASYAFKIEISQW